jgi:hypothetical protein
MAGRSPGEIAERDLSWLDWSRPSDLSADGRWAATVPADAPDRVTFVPTGTGEPKTVTFPGLSIGSGAWHPDGRRMVIQAATEKHLPRLVVIDRDGGAPRPITDEIAGVHGVVSPDGTWVAVGSPEVSGRLCVRPLHRGPRGRP